MSPTTILAFGGFGSGDPEAAAAYYNALRGANLPLPDVIDVHLYPQAPQDITALLSQFSAAWGGVVIVVGEWNLMNSGLTVDEFVSALARAGVLIAAWFCWSDGMVPGFGLIDSSGSETQEYTDLVTLTRSEIMANPFSFPSMSAGPAGPGLDAYMEAHGVHPVGLSTYLTTPDGFHWESVEGSDGAYYRATDESGQWVEEGPLPLA